MKTKIILTIALCTGLGYIANAKKTVPGHLTIKHAVAKKKYSMDEIVSNLQYDFARASVRTAYDDRLDQLANLIIEKKYAVALRGYADSIGTYKGNWVLSQKRSDAVKNYLIKKGVSQNQIVSTAFGSTNPVATNKTAAGRQLNRRVEIKLQPIDQ